MGVPVKGIRCIRLTDSCRDVGSGMIRSLIMHRAMFGPGETCMLNISPTEQTRQRRVKRLLFRSIDGDDLMFMLVNSEYVAALSA